MAAMKVVRKVEWWAGEMDEMSAATWAAEWAATWVDERVEPWVGGLAAMTVVRKVDMRVDQWA